MVFPRWSEIYVLELLRTNQISHLIKEKTINYFTHYKIADYMCYLFLTINFKETLLATDKIMFSH